VAAYSRADILLMEWNVQKVARTVLKKWWRSFGYDYVLAAIRAKLLEVTACLWFILLKLIDSDSVVAFSDIVE
jgi:hypothetical protein